MTTEVRKEKIAAWEKRLKPAEEDYINSKYFLVTKTLLCIVGVWPFQSRLNAYSRRLFVYSIIIYHISGLFIASIKHYRERDMPRMMLTVTFFGFFCTFGSKYSMAVFSQKRFKELCKFMEDNWRTIKDEEENKHLHKFTKFGYILSTTYVVFHAAATLTYVMLPPTVPMLLNRYFPTHETPPPIYILDSTYPFDKQQHFYAQWIIESVSIVMPVIGFCSIDSCFVSCASHIVALLNILICRLNDLQKYENKDSNPDSLMGARNQIRDSIIFHNRILDFFDLLNESFSPIFIVMEFSAMLSIAIIVACFQDIHEPQDYIIYIGLLISMFIHILYISLNGQRIINFSENIYDAIWNSDWYNYPKEDQKMMIFMMMRTQEPLQLTSAGMHPINYEYFGLLMKTSISYITVITSFRLSKASE